MLVLRGPGQDHGECRIELLRGNEWPLQDARVVALVACADCSARLDAPLGGLSVEYPSEPGV